MKASYPEVVPVACAACHAVSNGSRPPTGYRATDAAIAATLPSGNGGTHRRAFVNCNSASIAAWSSPFLRNQPKRVEWGLCKTALRGRGGEISGWSPAGTCRIQPNQGTANAGESNRVFPG